MKKLLLIIVLSGIAIFQGFAADKPVFATEGEGVEFYRKKLTDGKFDSFTTLFGVMGAESDDKDKKDALVMLDPMMVIFMKDSGALIKVDVCLAPKLGDSILRVGYILLYEHNLAFIDCWFTHDKEGWKLVNIDGRFNTDTVKTLQSISNQYYQHP